MWRGGAKNVSSLNIFAKTTVKAQCVTFTGVRWQKMRLEIHVLLLAAPDPRETLDTVIQPQLLITIYHLIDEAQVTLQCA